jgi:hypothetical protein
MTPSTSQPSDGPEQPDATDRPAKLAEDPRAKRALEKKNPGGGQSAGGPGSGHSKATNASSKQGKREKKVRW